MAEQDAGYRTLFRVMHPAGFGRNVEQIPLSPRIADMGDKVVYCISQYIGGSDIFLQKVADLLPRYAGGVKTVYRRKPGNYQIDDPDLWEEIEKEGDAVIYGCGA